MSHEKFSSRPVLKDLRVITGVVTRHLAYSGGHKLPGESYTSVTIDGQEFLRVSGRTGVGLLSQGVSGKSYPQSVWNVIEEMAIAYPQFFTEYVDVQTNAPETAPVPDYDGPRVVHLGGIVKLHIDATGQFHRIDGPSFEPINGSDIPAQWRYEGAVINDESGTELDDGKRLVRIAPDRQSLIIEHRSNEFMRERQKAADKDALDRATLEARLAYAIKRSKANKVRVVKAIRGAGGFDVAGSYMGVSEVYINTDDSLTTIGYLRTDTILTGDEYKPVVTIKLVTEGWRLAATSWNRYDVTEYTGERLASVLAAHASITQALTKFGEDVTITAPGSNS